MYACFVHADGRELRRARPFQHPHIWMQVGSPAHWLSQLLSQLLLVLDDAPPSPPRGRHVPLSSCSQTTSELL